MNYYSNQYVPSGFTTPSGVIPTVSGVLTTMSGTIPAACSRFVEDPNWVPDPNRDKKLRALSNKRYQ